MVIIYLSSGVTSPDSSDREKRETLSVVKEENRHLNNSVMILTYALMNGNAPHTVVLTLVLVSGNRTAVLYLLVNAELSVGATTEVLCQEFRCFGHLPC